MSLDAGGVAQMTYDPNSFNGGLGLPTSGFASRGKGSNIKRLSVAPPSSIGTIDENPPSHPRTSRSHLLAGLRTAPKSPAPVPSSAPPTQLQMPLGPQDNRHASAIATPHGPSPPKSAMSAGFGGAQGNPMGMLHHQQQAPPVANMSGINQIYSPDQILAPPAIQVGNGEDSPMDPVFYEELVRTNQYLAAQQLRLQQQLLNVTAAAQQFQNMNISSAQPPMQAAPGLSLYEQQMQYGLQPVVDEVPNQPGLFSVYNPMTKQTSYYFDHAASSSPAPDARRQHASRPSQSQSPPAPTPMFRAQVSPPPDSPSPAAQPPSMSKWRSSTPPRINNSPPVGEAQPLPPPSANAFRPGHRKGLSLANSTSNASVDKTSAALKSAGLPPTPMTGTFGPGQGREGEHPIRQPRGPPSLEELVAKPTARFEGSKNFASRQRRRALNNLVRAGMERRGASRSGTGDSTLSSAKSASPTSEEEVLMSPVSDDLDRGRAGNAGSMARPGHLLRTSSGNVSGRPSAANSRQSSHGAIGSERAELHERSRGSGRVSGLIGSPSTGSMDHYRTMSVGRDDDKSLNGSATGSAVELARPESLMDEKRRSNLLLLAGAEKRRHLAF